ncbi:MAG: hypothetical protein O3A20_07200 [Planctomycetota bacterium]|nr:hypothetical protein [Planctomycetota bacterium]
MKMAALLLVLALATGAAVWGYVQHGPGFMQVALGIAEEPKPRKEWTPPSMAAAPVVVSDNVMAWVRDERWDRGVTAGEAGAALIELAYDEHFNVKGDPFLFRNRKEEAARLLTAAIADLQALREDYAKNAAACLDVDPLVRKYEKALTKTPRR